MARARSEPRLCRVSACASRPPSHTEAAVFLAAIGLRDRAERELALASQRVDVTAVRDAIRFLDGQTVEDVSAGSVPPALERAYRVRRDARPDVDDLRIDVESEPWRAIEFVLPVAPRLDEPGGIADLVFVPGPAPARRSPVFLRAVGQRARGD